MAGSRRSKVKFPWNSRMAILKQFNLSLKRRLSSSPSCCVVVFILLQMSQSVFVQGSIQGVGAVNSSPDEMTTMSWKLFMEIDAQNLRRKRAFDVSETTAPVASVTTEGSGVGETNGTMPASETTAARVLVTTMTTESPGMSETTGTMPASETTATGVSVTSMTTESSGMGETTGTMPASETTAAGGSVTSTITESSGMSETTGTMPASKTTTAGASVTSVTAESSEMGETTAAGASVTSMTTESSGMGETTETMPASETTAAGASVTSMTTESSGMGETTGTMPALQSTTAMEGSGMGTTTGETLTGVTDNTISDTPTELAASTLPDDVMATPGNDACDSCNSSTEFCVVGAVERCECRPGFVWMENNACTPAKQFGGILHMDEPFDEELNDPMSVHFVAARDVYEDFLRIAYGGQDWFLSVRVVGFSEGSTLVSYELGTADDPAINSTIVQAAFGKFLENTTYFSNCSCSEENCQPLNVTGVNATVMANRSCVDAGTARFVVCQSPGVATYCSNDSTICSASLNGDVVCECMDGLSRINGSSCVATVCLTQSNTGCNPPFGTCLDTQDGAGRCSCMWGFDGANCQQVWLFVLVIVLSALVLIAIIVIVVYIWKRKHSAKGWDTRDTGRYGQNNDPYARLGGYQSWSEFDAPVHGVVATSYKRTLEFEPYDSISMGARSDRTENGNGASNIPQLPIEHWRVSELEKEGRYVSGENFELAEVGDQVHENTKAVTTSEEQATRI